MNRRDFLKTLTAAAGTAVVGQTALAQLPVVEESNVTGYGWSEVGNGWYRVWKTFKGSMFNCSINFGDGLYLDEDSRAQLYQSDNQELTFSCYIKGVDPEEALNKVEVLSIDRGYVYSPQIEFRPQPTSYIPTIGEKHD